MLQCASCARMLVVNEIQVRMRKRCTFKTEKERGGNHDYSRKHSVRDYDIEKEEESDR